MLHGQGFIIKPMRQLGGHHLDGHVVFWNNELSDQAFQEVSRGISVFMSYSVVCRLSPLALFAILAKGVGICSRFADVA